MFSIEMLSALFPYFVLAVVGWIWTSILTEIRYKEQHHRYQYWADKIGTITSIVYNDAKSERDRLRKSKNSADSETEKPTVSKTGKKSYVIVNEND